MIKRYSNQDIDRRVAKWGPRCLRGLTDQVIAEKVAEPLSGLVMSEELPGQIVLLGPTGCGKTLTAFAMARRWLRAQYERVYSMPDPQDRIGVIPKPAWVNVPDLSRARARHPLGRGESEEIEKAIDSDFAVMDECGWEPQSDTVFRDVLSARNLEGKPTIFTSGFTKQQIGDRYGDAVVRRMNELRGELCDIIDLHPEEPEKEPEGE